MHWLKSCSPVFDSFLSRRSFCPCSLSATCSSGGKRCKTRHFSSYEVGSVVQKNSVRTPRMESNMNSNKMEQQAGFWLYCWRHIVACTVPKRQGRHHFLQSHTRTHLLRWALSLRRSRLAVDCSRRPPCSWDGGSEPVPDSQQLGWYSGGMQSFWPIGLSIIGSWPPCCLVAK